MICFVAYVLVRFEASLGNCALSGDRVMMEPPDNHCTGTSAMECTRQRAPGSVVDLGTHTPGVKHGLSSDKRNKHSKLQLYTDNCFVESRGAPQVDNRSAKHTETDTGYVRKPFLLCKALHTVSSRATPDATNTLQVQPVLLLRE